MVPPIVSHSVLEKRPYYTISVESPEQTTTAAHILQDYHNLQEVFRMDHAIQPCLTGHETGLSTSSLTPHLLRARSSSSESYIEEAQASGIICPSA